MVRIGPWTFSDADVHSTLEDGWNLFERLELRLPPEMVAVVEPHRVVAEAVLEEVLVGAIDPAAAIEVLWERWRGAMGDLRSHGAFGGQAWGSVAGLWRSDGGVPKEGVPSLVIDHAGVVGDRQDDRRHHGRPFQAVCIWSTEVIDGFRADGHPLAPGLAGENVTVSGIAWDRFRPGVHVDVGTARLEISSYAVPCHKNRDWFLGGRFDLMHHKHGPISRVYATVLEEGRVSVGDAVVLEPAASVRETGAT